MKVEIRSRWSGALLFSLDAESLSFAVEAAVKSGANLTDADLTDANLTPIRDDLWAVLSAAPSEVVGLRAAIAEG